MGCWVWVRTVALDAPRARTCALIEPASVRGFSRGAAGASVANSTAAIAASTPTTALMRVAARAGTALPGGHAT